MNSQNLEARIAVANKNVRKIKKYNILQNELADLLNQYLSDCGTNIQINADILIHFMNQYIYCYRKQLYQPIDDFTPPILLNNAEKLIQALGLTYSPKFSEITMLIYSATVKYLTLYKKELVADLKAQASTEFSVLYRYQLENIFIRYGLTKELFDITDYFQCDNVLYYQPQNDRKALIVTSDLIKYFYVEKISSTFPPNQNNLQKKQILKFIPTSTANLQIRQTLLKNCTKKKLASVNHPLFNYASNLYKLNHYSNSFDIQPYIPEYLLPVTPLICPMDKIEGELPDSLRQSASSLSCNSISGLRFWGQFVKQLYSWYAPKALFFIQVSSINDVEPLILHLETYFNNPPLLFQNLPGADTLLQNIFQSDERYQYMVSVVKPENKNQLPLYIKMAKSEQLLLSIPNQKGEFPYKNRLPHLLIYEKHNSAYIKTLQNKCELGNVSTFTLTWNSDSQITEISDSERILLHWLFLSANWHRKAPVVHKTTTAAISALDSFIKTFCTITGYVQDNMRSQLLYENYILPYYTLCNVNIRDSGYKKFNRNLKSYAEGVIQIRSIHVSKGDNVQHIMGLRFDSEKFNTYMSDCAAESDNNSKIFHAFLNELCASLISDLEKIKSTIHESEVD